MQRRRLTQTESLEERFAEEAKRLHEQAELLPYGDLRKIVEEKLGKPRPALISASG